MDRNFLSYYETELAHIRELAGEFAALHPTVARNLSLDSVPCPDPYVERLLEGVAYLAARTRLKVDAESARYVCNLLDALYPDLVGPAPAMTMAILQPGPQVQTMPDGHTVPRGARMIAAFREGLATRATYTTAQDLTLWPVAIEKADYLPDRGALAAAGVPEADLAKAEAGIRLTIGRAGPGNLADLSLDRLDVHFTAGPRAGALFDAAVGRGRAVLARPERPGASWLRASAPGMVGLGDGEALLPRLRHSFEGYRLLREYFLMPERFHYMRLCGVNPALRACKLGDRVEVLVLLARARAELSGLATRDFALFATPIVNLFEKEVNVVDLDGRASAHVVHADRTRPRDFEIYRLIRVEDADSDGPEARLHSLYAADQMRGSGLLYTTERRPRRPGEDEIRRGQTRTSYTGDDLFISVVRPPHAGMAALKRLDIRALCTNRDLPILDDNPVLGMETGDPVARIELLGAMRRPRNSVVASLPRMAEGGETALDDLTWRLIGQLSLNHLSLADATEGAEPLRALLDLYADRGDPALARHGRSVTRVTSRAIVERLDIAGPLCFGKGVEIALTVDEQLLSGGSVLLLSALLNALFARQAGINSFVRTRTISAQTQEEVQWPITPGIRALI
jgi:type VI secretion system protein ImpG